MPKHAHFTPDALQFLRDLARHNDRAWFEAQRARYATSLQEPFVRLLEELAPRLARIDPAYVVDARAHGGSLARIHRDMRFVKDGKPFKTALSAHFPHRKALAKQEARTGASTSGAVPSFFLVLEPGLSRLGAGIRTPDAAAKKKLEKLAASDERAWAKVTRPGTRTRFVLTLPLTDAQVSAPRLLDDVVAGYREVAPFLRAVAAAVGARS